MTFEHENFKYEVCSDFPPTLHRRAGEQQHISAVRFESTHDIVYVHPYLDQPNRVFADALNDPADRGWRPIERGFPHTLLECSEEQLDELVARWKFGDERNTVVRAELGQVYQVVQALATVNPEFRHWQRE